MKQVPRKVKIFSTSVYTIWKQGEYTIPIHSYHIAWGNQCRSTVTHHRCVPRQYCLPFAAVNNFEGMVGRGRCRGCMCPVVLCVLGVSFHHPSIRQRQGGYNVLESSSNNVQQTVSTREKKNSSIRLHALSLEQQYSLVRKTEQRGTLTQQQRPSDDLDPFHGNRPIPNNRGIRQRCRPSNNSASIQCDLRTRPT